MKLMKNSVSHNCIFLACLRPSFWAVHAARDKLWNSAIV